MARFLQLSGKDDYVNLHHIDRIQGVTVHSYDPSRTECSIAGSGGSGGVFVTTGQFGFAELVVHEVSNDVAGAIVDDLLRYARAGVGGRADT